MLEIYSVIGKTITYYCPDCEGQYGCKMRFSYTVGEKSLAYRKFFDQHEHCGEECPWMWTKEADEEWASGLEVMKKIYADHPGIKFEEAKKLYELNDLGAGGKLETPTPKKEMIETNSNHGEKE